LNAANTLLKKDVLVESTKHGYSRITEEGRSHLEHLSVKGVGE